MFSMKPIVNPDLPIDVSTCMYKMKNIVSNNVSPSGWNSNEHRDQHVTDICQQKDQGANQKLVEILEERQDLILKQLSDLRKQIQNIRGYLKSSVPEGLKIRPENNSSENVNFSSNDNFVIKISPECVPYSLLVLQKLWVTCGLHLLVKSHLHSSTRLPKAAQEFNDSIQQGTKQLESVTHPMNKKLVVTLLWKNVENSELVVSPLKPAIFGEVNILRYLSRLGPSKYNYENSANLPAIIAIDSIFDICYQIDTTTNKSKKQSFMHTLVQTSKKNGGWFSETQDIRMVDVAVFSLVKRTDYLLPTITKEPQMKVWFQKLMNICKS